MSVSTFAEHMTTCVRSVEKALPRPKQLVLTSKSPQDMAIIANRWQRRDRRKWTDKYRGKDRNVKKDASVKRVSAEGDCRDDFCVHFQVNP